MAQQDKDLAGSKSLFFIFSSILILVLIFYVIILSIHTSKSTRFLGRSEQVQNTISVSGSGSVTGIPDVMTIQMGFNTEAKSVSDAQTEHTRKLNTLIRRLKEQGVEEKDIKTTSYNVFPQYDFIEGRREFRDYQVSAQVEVRVRDLEKSSDVLDLIGVLGVDQVHGLRFEIDDPEQLKDDARQMAIEDARDKAKTLAKELGINLGTVVGFNESTGGFPQPFPFASSESFLDARGGAIEAPSVQPGESEVMIDVHLTYEIQ